MKAKVTASFLNVVAVSDEQVVSTCEIIWRDSNSRRSTIAAMGREVTMDFITGLQGSKSLDVTSYAPQIMTPSW